MLVDQHNRALAILQKDLEDVVMAEVFHPLEHATGEAGAYGGTETMQAKPMELRMTCTALLT